MRSKRSTVGRIVTVVALTGALGASGYVWVAERLTLDGVAVVKAVDDRRVVVAIDTTNEGRPADGLVDHVFLFTANRPIEFADPQDVGPVHLEFDGDHLVVVRGERGRTLEFVVRSELRPLPPGRHGAVRFDDAFGLSHYHGWDSFGMSDLEGIERSETCDHVPGSCYEANGHPLHFPG